MLCALVHTANTSSVYEGVGDCAGCAWCCSERPAVMLLLNQQRPIRCCASSDCLVYFHVPCLCCAGNQALMQPFHLYPCRRQSSPCQTVLPALLRLLVLQTQLGLQLQQMPPAGSILRAPGSLVLRVIRSVRSTLHARQSPHTLTSRQRRHSALCLGRWPLQHLHNSSLSCQQAASRQCLGQLQKPTLQQAASMGCLGQTQGASQRLVSQRLRRSRILASSRP